MNRFGDHSDNCLFFNTIKVQQFSQTTNFLSIFNSSNSRYFNNTNKIGEHLLVGERGLFGLYPCRPCSIHPFRVNPLIRVPQSSFVESVL